MIKGVKYTKLVKGRLNEGQPLSMRTGGKPTGKRPFDAGIEGSKELNYLRKALTALGGKEVDQYATANGAYTRGGSGHNQMWHDTVEVWEFSDHDYDERTQVLDEYMHGTVHINKKGEVSYEFKLDFGHPFTKSLQKIFKRAGLKDFGMEQTKNEDKANSNVESDYRLRDEDGYSEETPFDYVAGKLSISEAAVAFNKLVKILDSANASYNGVKGLSPEEYWVKKGQIADPNGMLVKFEIIRDSDGSAYVEGDFDNDTIRVGEAGQDNMDDHSARGALEEICNILDMIGSYSDGSPDFSRALRQMPKSPASDVKGFKETLQDLVVQLNKVIDQYNNELDDDDAEELWWDNLEVTFDSEEAVMNDARAKKVAKMEANVERDAKHRYESVMRHIRSIKESSQWNRETNPYAKAAFDAVFNLIDSSYIDVDEAEDDQVEAEYRAENNEMFQNILQGIYHALEQFIPQVNDIFGPEGLDIIFGDELYDLGI